MLLVAWIVYFAVWGVSQLLLARKISKPAIVVMSAISLVDIVYLMIYDLRSFVLVILATVFAMMGVVKGLTLNMKGGE